MRRSDIANVIKGASDEGTAAFKTGAESAMQDKDAALKNWLLGKKVEQLKALRADPSIPKDSDISLDGASIRPPNEFDRAMKQNLLDQRRQDKLNAQVTGLSDRDMKAGLAQRQATLTGIEDATATPGGGGILTDPNYQVKSGPIANATRKLPLVGPLLTAGAEKIGLLPQGAEKEAQAIQRLINVDTKQMMGTAVNKFEEGRQLIEKGMSSGDPDAIKRGMQMAVAAYKADQGSIRAAYPPEVIAEFEKRGGTPGIETLLKPKTPQGISTVSAPGGMSPDARKARIAELRAKLGK
jgi:hypothetical protein